MASLWPIHPTRPPGCLNPNYTVKPMNTPLHQTVEAMHKRGDSFVSGLGSLLLIADPQNRQRLLRAFPEIVERYEAIAVMEETKRMLEGSLFMHHELSPDMPASLNQFILN